MDQAKERDLMMSQFEFARLSDLPDLAEQCARLNDAEWGDGSAESIEMRISSFRRLALAGENEDVILCLGEKGELAGLCVLIDNELPAYEDLSPWLASLIVAPDFRGRGLALKLIAELESMAKEMGEGELFLHTRYPELYKKAGYAEIETYERDGNIHVVMGKAL
ncbi:MAG TPA: hypothetical protein DCS30_04160 [Rhizobiales bacterium]|nr:hypothetical protein [Hyphomicrobiales bacterium]